MQRSLLFLVLSQFQSAVQLMPISQEKIYLGQPKQQRTENELKKCSCLPGTVELDPNYSADFHEVKVCPIKLVEGELICSLKRSGCSEHVSICPAVTSDYCH